MTAELPLEVGTTVQCMWRDGKYHSARVLERRLRVEEAVSAQEGNKTENGGGAAQSATTTKEREGAMEYYVHYDEFNRRMDEWVSADKFNLSTAVRPEKPGVKVAKLDVRYLD